MWETHARADGVHTAAINPPNVPVAESVGSVRIDCRSWCRAGDDLRLAQARVSEPRRRIRAHDQTIGLRRRSDGDLPEQHSHGRTIAAASLEGGAPTDIRQAVEGEPLRE